MTGIIDPPPAPEGGSNARPSDLLNKPCIIRATGLGKWGEESKTPGKPYVVCDVWTLDRAGIVEHHEGMWIGWWKAVEQLKDNQGALVACRPTQQADNSIELTPLDGAAREVAVTSSKSLAVVDTEPPFEPEAAPPPAYDDGTEPF